MSANRVEPKLALGAANERRNAFGSASQTRDLLLPVGTTTAGVIVVAATTTTTTKSAVTTATWRPWRAERGPAPGRRARGSRCSKPHTWGCATPIHTIAVTDTLLATNPPSIIAASTLADSRR